MAGGIRKLKKGETLFNEGDDSDAMYVIKSGRIAITKTKGSSEINLAELKPGEMLGEMAFFDNKPRSAGAKAVAEASVIELPFNALHAQFKTFPEWLKAMVKTVNSHLRSANQRIKNLEEVSADDVQVFPPHTITRLIAIVNFIGLKSGKKSEEGLVIPSGLLRTYTIQVFQQPTHKMQKLLDVLSSLGHTKVEDLGEGRQRVTLLNPDLLLQFVDWYNEYLFKAEAKRTTIDQADLKTLSALIYYGNKLQANEKGEINISLTEMQNNSMKDLQYLVGVSDADNLIKKGVIGDKQQSQDGNITSIFLIEEVKKMLPFWQIVYALQGVTG